MHKDFKPKVLIVEDDIVPASYLKKIIAEEGDYLITGIVVSAVLAHDSIKRDKPDIIFMDIMIKGGVSGSELALEIKTLHPEILIIFLTAYSTDEMMEYAVDSSAFAYLLKPYRPNEIIATLKLAKSTLLKTQQTVNNEILLVDGFRYDFVEDGLFRGEMEILLSSHEIMLLKNLCKSPNSTVSRVQLMEVLDITSVALRSLIYRLRKHTSQDIVKTIKHYGYRVGLEKENTMR